MEAIEKICALLPEAVARAVRAHSNGLTELRLRPGGRPQLCFAKGDELLNAPLAPQEFQSTLARMLEYSLYAWEDELCRGFFTLPGGSRVGVCGRYAVQGEKISAVSYVSALCVRVAREVRGAGSALAGAMLDGDGVKSALVISRPGMGKTTLLRDAARLLSGAGKNVALADERGELAACRAGVPALDVGERTDVMDMCPKHIAIAHMVRSLRPDVVVTDEVGSRHDAAALLDARRSGAAVLASAHAAGLYEAARRPALREMLEGGAFDMVALLDGALGKIAALTAWEGCA